MEIDFSRVSLEPSLQYVCVCLGMKVECGGSIRFLSHCVCFVNVLGFVPSLLYIKLCIGSSRLSLILVDSLIH